MRAYRHYAARALCAVLVTLPLMFSPLRAQDAPDLERGHRIRFSWKVLDQHLPRDGSTGGSLVVDPGGLVTGTVLSTGPDSVVVRVREGGAQVALPWEDFHFLERFTGLSPAEATLGSAAAGGAVLAVVGAASWRERRCKYTGACWDAPHSRTKFAIGFGLTGAVLGGAVGLLLSAMGVSGDWTPVPLPARVELNAGTDRLGVSASVPF